MILRYYNMYGDQNFATFTELDWWYDDFKVFDCRGSFRADTKWDYPGIGWRLDGMERDEVYSYRDQDGTVDSACAVHKTPILQAVVRFFVYDAVVQEKRPWVTIWGHKNGFAESGHIDWNNPPFQMCEGVCDIL